MKHLFFILLWTCFSLNLVAQDFSMTPDEEHVFLLLPTTITNMSELGAAIAKHNHTHYETSALEVSTVAMNLEEKTIFYYIPGFKNKAVALDYYKSFAQHKSAAITKDNTKYYCIISTKNLNEVLKAKTLSSYNIFFEKYYSM